MKAFRWQLKQLLNRDLSVQEQPLVFGDIQGTLVDPSSTIR